MNAKSYLAKVATGRCICCELLGREQNGRTMAHHIREGQGMSQRSSDWLTVPLCYECHQGRLGIHGDRSYLRILKIDELDLLAETIKRMQQ
ncbi:MAG: hypothetical protein ACYCOR_17970 [Acidobacteriaceae bacterium]